MIPLFCFFRIFGLFSVPRKWYAVVYLIIMSVFIPGVSFIGHLCGIISGIRALCRLHGPVEIAGMQQMFCLVAQRLAEVFAVQRLYERIFM